MSTRNYRSTAREQYEQIQSGRIQDLQILLRREGESGDSRFDANTVYNMSPEELRAAAEEFVDATLEEQIEAVLDAGLPLTERLRDVLEEAADTASDADTPPPPMTAAEIIDRLKAKEGLTAVEIQDLVADTMIKEGIAAEAGEEPSTAPLEDVLGWTEAARRFQAREQLFDGAEGFGLDEASDEAVEEALDDAGSSSLQGRDLSSEELAAKIAEAQRALDESPLQRAVEDAGLTDLAERIRVETERVDETTNAVKDAIEAAAADADREAGRVVDEAGTGVRDAIERATTEATEAIDAVRATVVEAGTELGRNADRLGESLDDAISRAIEDVDVATGQVGDVLSRIGDALNAVPGGVTVTWDVGSVVDGMGSSGQDGMAPPDAGEAPQSQTLGDRAAGYLAGRLGSTGGASSSGGDGQSTSGTQEGGGGASGSLGGVLGGTDPSALDRGLFPADGTGGQPSGGTTGGDAGGTTGGADAGAGPEAGSDEPPVDEGTPEWETIYSGDNSYTKESDGVWRDDATGEAVDAATQEALDAAAAEMDASEEQAGDDGSVEYTPSGEGGSGRERPELDASRAQYEQIMREAEANSNVNPTREGSEVLTGSVVDAMDSDVLKQPAPDGDLAQQEVVVRGPGFGSAQGDGVVMPGPDDDVQYEQGLGGDVPVVVGPDAGLGHLADQAAGTPTEDPPEGPVPAGVSPSDLRIGGDRTQDLVDLRIVAPPPALVEGGMSAIAPTYEDANPGPVPDDAAPTEPEEPPLLLVPEEPVRSVEESSLGALFEDQDVTRWERDPDPDDDPDGAS